MCTVPGISERSMAFMSLILVFYYDNRAVTDLTSIRKILRGE